jgi:hypothetical protein
MITTKGAVMKHFRVCIFFLLIGSLALLETACYPGCEDLCECGFGGEIFPPLGLEAIPGDREVTLHFHSANAFEDDYNFYGFAVHMAKGEYLTNPVSQNYYNATDIVAFDAYGDGIVCGGECDYEQSGLMPVAYISGGAEAVEAALDVEIPGEVTWQIKNRDPAICYYYDYLAPCTSTSDIDQTDIANCQWGEGDTICLENNVTYTVFVVTRAAEGSYASWTSNWVSFTPTAATEPVE